MLCPTCGYPCQDHAFFCLNCGSPLTPDSSVPGGPVLSRKVPGPGVIPVTDPGKIYDQGTVYFNNGNYATALVLFSKALEADPSLDRAWNAKGASYARLGRYGEALKCYEKALMLKPGDRKYLDNRQKSILKQSADPFRQVPVKYIVNSQTPDPTSVTSSSVPGGPVSYGPYRANIPIMALCLAFWAVPFLSYFLVTGVQAWSSLVLLGIATAGALLAYRDARFLGSGKNPSAAGLERWRPGSWGWFLFILFPVSSLVYLLKRKRIFMTNRESRDLPYLPKTPGQVVVRGLGVLVMLASGTMVIVSFIPVISGLLS